MLNNIGSINIKGCDISIYGSLEDRTTAIDLVKYETSKLLALTGVSSVIWMGLETKQSVSHQLESLRVFLNSRLGGLDNE